MPRTLKRERERSDSWRNMGFCVWIMRVYMFILGIWHNFKTQNNMSLNPFTMLNYLVGGALGHSWHGICMTLLEISWLWPCTKLQAPTSFSDSVETTALTQPLAVCQVLLRMDHRCTLRFGTKFIDALLGLEHSSSMHFEFWNQVHRCTFGFGTLFIDALLGLGPGSSMHFWVWDRVHRCTFRFGTEFIDALSGLGLSSSMHFGVWDRVHQCTLGFWIQFINAHGWLEAGFSIHRCTLRLRAHWWNQLPGCLPGASEWMVELCFGVKSALMSNLNFNFFINGS